MENICRTGGSPGSDYIWGEYAKILGHKVEVITFGRHKVCKDPEDKQIILTDYQLKEVDSILEVVSEKIRRIYPSSRGDPANNLLRKIVHTVRGVSSVYAIGSIGKDDLIIGQTAWGIAIYLYLNQNPNCWFYNQIPGIWLHWEEGKWKLRPNPPQPQGLWAGIGTREINTGGRRAIRDLMQLSKHNLP